MLQGVASRGLFIALGIGTKPGGSRPRGARELKGAGLVARYALRQGCSCLLDLLDLQGGGSCRRLGSDRPLCDSDRLVRDANVDALGISGNWAGRQ
jgi:hypothetical protein